MDSLGLELCGPFDIITGKLPVHNLDSRDQTAIDKTGGKSSADNDDDNDIRFHLHSRFYYDPPEFMTLIKDSANKNGFHIGYFR